VVMWETAAKPKQTNPSIRMKPIMCSHPILDAYAKTTTP
jgi:hypothetical protein